MGVTFPKVWTYLGLSKNSGASCLGHVSAVEQGGVGGGGQRVELLHDGRHVGVHLDCQLLYLVPDLRHLSLHHRITALQGTRTRTRQ
jgi:hypothetical protein